MKELHLQALASDKEYQALIAKREATQKKLESTFPEAFLDVDAAKSKQGEIRKELLNNDPKFKKGQDNIASAYYAAKNYLREKHSDLLAAEELANKVKEQEKKPKKK